MTGIECVYFDGGDLDWEGIATWAGSGPCHSLRQSWLPEPDPVFRPGSIRTFWNGRGIGVHAELEDADIFNSATGENARLWESGDVFEIFLKPPGLRYGEFQIGPGNQRLQLSYESEQLFRSRKGRFFEKPDDWLEGIALPPGSFGSAVRIPAGQNQWQVLAFIPLRTLGLPGELKAGDTWLCNFCRYDYTRGADRPVLSSSSNLTRPDFHDQSGWNRLLFKK